MNLSKFDLNLFLVFDTIYHERNLTQSARVLSITQPAVSNSLARLRVLFKDELFIRSSGGMRPTPVADDIALHVQQALSLLDTSLREREEFEPATSARVFRFSMTDLAEAVVLPRLFTTFPKSAPGISVESYYSRRGEIGNKLLRGDLDFAIDVSVVEDPQLRHQSLISDDYVCALRWDHPHESDTLSLEQYMGLQHMHISSRRKGLGQVDIALKEKNLERDVRLRVQHYRAIPETIKTTDLAVTVPRFLATQYDLRTLELPFAVPKMEIHLYWYKNSDHDDASVWLRTTLFGLFS